MPTINNTLPYIETMNFIKLFERVQKILMCVKYKFLFF